jgi:hypothetical protein
MDSGLTIRPTTTVAETVHVRPEIASVRTAVPTTLAASKSVVAAPDSSRTAGYDPGRMPAPQPSQPEVTRQVVLDPQTREVIYRVIDVRTGQVARQTPDAALLRLRAYIKALAKGENPIMAESATDRAV